MILQTVLQCYWAISDTGDPQVPQKRSKMVEIAQNKFFSPHTHGNPQNEKCYQLYGSGC